MATNNKYEHLKAKFAELNKAGTGPTKLNPTQAIAVIGVLDKHLGVGTAFEIKQLGMAITVALWKAIGITDEPTSLTQHALSLKTAQILRQAKEVEVEGTVLLNNPQDGNRPSKWALFKVS